jgi:hypothetical protein
MMSNYKREGKDKGQSRSVNERDENVEILVVDEPGDATIRPARYDIPRDWPRPALPAPQATSEAPPETKED